MKLKSITENIVNNSKNKDNIFSFYTNLCFVVKFTSITLNNSCPTKGNIHAKLGILTYIEEHRGIRQGCPLSGLLFVIGIEILGLAIRCSSSTKGINIESGKLENWHNMRMTLLSLKMMFNQYTKSFTCFLVKGDSFP